MGGAPGAGEGVGSWMLEVGGWRLEVGELQFHLQFYSNFNALP